MDAELNWKYFQNESCYYKSNSIHICMYPTYSFPHLVKRIRVSWFCRSPGTKTSRNWSQVLAMHEAVTISIEASPESSHFPVAWPGLTPEGRRSACVKQSSGTRRQGQGSGNQETSTAASPTPRHPSRQPGAAPIGSGREGGLCSCEGQNRPSTLALTLADGPRTRATTLSFLVVPSHERERIVTMFLMQR